MTNIEKFESWLEKNHPGAKVRFTSADHPKTDPMFEPGRIGLNYGVPENLPWVAAWEWRPFVRPNDARDFPDITTAMNHPLELALA